MIAGRDKVCGPGTMTFLGADQPNRRNLNGLRRLIFSENQGEEFPVLVILSAFRVLRVAKFPGLPCRSGFA
jgi:hypothetical protein